MKTFKFFLPLVLAAFNHFLALALLFFNPTPMMSGAYAMSVAILCYVLLDMRMSLIHDRINGLTDLVTTFAESNIGILQFLTGASNDQDQSQDQATVADKQVS